MRCILVKKHPISMGFPFREALRWTLNQRGNRGTMRKSTWLARQFSEKQKKPIFRYGLGKCAFQKLDFYHWVRGSGTDRQRQIWE